MDELKMILSTEPMKRMVAKMISKVVSGKLGHKIYIEPNNIGIKSENGKVFLHVDADITMDNAELMKLIASAGLD